jgi:hypothetical protein
VPSWTKWFKDGDYLLRSIAANGPEADAPLANIKTTIEFRPEMEGRRHSTRLALSDGVLSADETDVSLGDREIKCKRFVYVFWHGKKKDGETTGVADGTIS